MKLHLHSVVSAIKPAFQKLNTARKNQDERMANWLEKRLLPKQLKVAQAANDEIVPEAPAYIPVGPNDKKVKVPDHFAWGGEDRKAEFDELLEQHWRSGIGLDGREKLRKAMVTTLETAREELVEQSKTAPNSDKRLIGAAIHDINKKLAKLK